MSSCCILPESQALNKNFLLRLSHSYIILIKIILDLQDDQLKTKQTFHLHLLHMMNQDFPYRVALSENGIRC